MKLSRMEQETIINFNEAYPTATIYTHKPALHRKLEQLCDQLPGDAKRGRTFPDGGQEYIVPKRWVKVNASRILSEAQKANLTGRLRMQKQNRA